MADKRTIVKGHENGNLEYLISAVCLNPLILDKIFSFLDIATVKFMRTVCQVWGQVGIKTLGRRTRIHIMKHVPCCQQISQIPGQFNNKIWKNFRLDFGCFCVSYWCNTHQRFGGYEDSDGNYVQKSNDTMAANFRVIMMSPVHSSLVELSLIDISSMEFFTVFMEIFATLKLQTLKKLGINWRRVEDEEFNFPEETPTFQRLPQLMKLRILGCPGHAFMGEATTRKLAATGKFFPIFQNLIDASALTLKTLEIQNTNFYPNLSQCVNMSKLEVAGLTQFWPATLHTTNGPNTFDSKGILRMCYQVRKSLRTLRLSAQGHDYGLEVLSQLQLLNQKFPFVLPSMPNLTFLSVYLNVYDLRKSLSMTLLPACKRLHISTSLGEEPSDVFNPILVPHEGIKELDLRCSDFNPTHLHSASVESNICKLLPNVRKVFLSWVSRLLDADDDSREIETLIKLLLDWNLVQLDLDLYAHRHFSTIVTMLETSAQITGNKNICIGVGVYIQGNDQISPHLNRIKAAFSLFLPTDSIRFRGAMLAQETVDAIITIAADNNVKVVFDLTFKKMLIPLS